MRLRDAIYFLLNRTTIIEDIPVTMLDAVPHTAGSPVTARRFGNVIFIAGEISPKQQVAAGGSLKICSIPAKYAPSGRFPRAVFQGSNMNIWTGVIGLYDGECQVRLERYRTGSTANVIPTTAWLPFYFTYIMGDNV